MLKLIKYPLANQSKKYEEFGKVIHRRRHIIGAACRDACANTKPTAVAQSAQHSARSNFKRTKAEGDMPQDSRALDYGSAI
jgi:hypothetical protein